LRTCGGKHPKADPLPSRRLGQRPLDRPGQSAPARLDLAAEVRERGAVAPDQVVARAALCHRRNRELLGGAARGSVLSGLQVSSEAPAMTNRNEAPASTGGDGPSYALAPQHGARTNCSTAARPRDGKKLSEKVRRDNSLRCLMPALLGHFIDRHGRASMVSAMVTGVDRCR
jgi:hypothetical protein